MHEILFSFLLTLYFGNVCLMLDLTEGAAYKWQMNLARLVHLVEERHKRQSTIIYWRCTLEERWMRKTKMCKL